MGTAQIGGAFYNVGAAINDALNDGKEEGGWRQSNAEATGGSLENYRLLESGDIQIGMANSSISYFAVRGTAGFDKKYDVKTIMTMFPLIGMFVTKKGQGIESLADVNGKRVSEEQPGFFSERLTEIPTLAVIASNESLSIGSVGGTHLFCIPLDFLPGAIRDVAEMVGLGQQAGVFKVAQCRSAAFARDNPVLVMAGRARNERVRAFEIGKRFFRKQNMFPEIG